MHQHFKRRQCVLCLKPVYLEASLYHILYEPKICVSCIQKFEVIYASKKLEGYMIQVLYAYNEFFKQLLFQYKGLYDMALKDVFLDIFHQELKNRYRKYLIVVVPSSQRDNARRGFVPNEEIVNTLGVDIFTGIYKTKEYKQTSQVHRSDVADILAIVGGNSIRGRKVVIFDDVITSGNTIITCISLIKKYHPKSIEIMVLATNQMLTLFKK